MRVCLQTYWGGKKIIKKYKGATPEERWKRRQAEKRENEEQIMDRIVIIVDAPKEMDNGKDEEAE